MSRQSPFVPVCKLRLLGSLVTDFPRVQQLHTLKAYSKSRGTLYVMCTSILGTRFRWAVIFKLRPPHAIRGMRGLDGPTGGKAQTVAPLPIYGLLHLKMWVQILQGVTGPLAGWLTPAYSLSAKQLSYHNLAEFTKRTTPPEPKICVILKKLHQLPIFTNHFSVIMYRLGHSATPAPQPFSDVLLVPI